MFVPRALEQDRAAARLASAHVSHAVGVPLERIAADQRGCAQEARARQLAMYLTHVAFSISLARVAIAFGRDRSTVAHACRLVEDLRDDPDLDSALDAIESALREAPRPGALAL